MARRCGPVRLGLPPLLALAACTGAPDEVGCADDSQCTLDGRDGRCEASRLCSFADAACATGWRYVDGYAGARSATCVPAELPAWVTVIGGATLDELSELALGPQGQLYVLGRFFDSLRLPVPLDGFENYDLLLAALDGARGTTRWLTPIGGGQSDSPGGLGLVGERLHLAGRFAATLHLGDAELRKGATSQPFTVFRAVLDDQGDRPALVAAAVERGDGLVAATAVDGAAVVGEWSEGTLDFTAGSPSDARSTEAPAVWLALPQAGGAVADDWGQSAALLPEPTGEIRAAALLAEPAGAATPTTLTLAGRYLGAVSFAGAPLLPASQQGDGYVVTFGGAPLAAQSFTTVRGAGPDALTALARAGGELIAGGSGAGALTLGGVALAPIGSQDALVFGASGRFRPWRAGAAGGETAVRALAAIGERGAFGDAADVIVAGTYTRPLLLGGIALPHRGGRDVFVARLHPDASVAWARGFGGPEDDLVADVAVAQDGTVFLGGTFSGTIELGGGATREAAGDSDWFVLALRP